MENSNVCGMKKPLPSPINVGELVRNILHAKGIKHKLVSDHLGIAPSNFSTMLSQEAWDIRIINAVGELIGINLFAYFVAGREYDSMVMEGSPAYAAHNTEKQLSVCQQELAAVKEKAALLKENNEYLKKHNRELEIEINKLRKS
jgi:hypothetical protein